jgi:polysaccharide transporter, PST family
VQIARYLIPFIYIPYLARTLGPDGWGLIAFTQSFVAIIALIIEFGFDLSAVREIARFNGDRSRREEILCQINSAKIILILFVLFIAFFLKSLIPIFQNNSELYWASIFCSICFALNFLWYFQGIEKMRLVAILEIISRIISVVLIVIFIKNNGDEWLVFLFQGLSSMAIVLISLFLINRENTLHIPSIKSGIKGFKMGWNIFLIKCTSSIYAIGNAFILGLIVPLEYVGYYAGADKVVKIARESLKPITQTFFPRISNMIKTNYTQGAKNYITVSAIIMIVGGVLIGLCLYIFSPLIVKITFGSGYEETITVLRIMSILPFIVSISNVLGIQWMLPMGLDKTFLIIISAAAMINVILAYFIAPKFLHIGMSWVLVVTETFITVLIISTLFLKDINPFTSISLSKDRKI